MSHFCHCAFCSSLYFIDMLQFLIALRDHGTQKFAFFFCQLLIISIFHVSVIQNSHRISLMRAWLQMIPLSVCPLVFILIAWKLLFFFFPLGSTSN